MVRPDGRHQQRAVARVERRAVHLVNPRAGVALGADGPPQRVGVVVVVGGVPGVGAGLVEVAVEGGGGVRVPGEGQV